MPDQPPPPKHPAPPQPFDPGASGVPAVPMSMDELVQGVFAIKPEDVKKIVASKPGERKK